MNTITGLDVSRFDFKAMTEPVNAVDAYLADFIKQRPMSSNLREAIQYAMFNGGKRLRPLLTLRCCQATGGKAEQAMAAAGAVELIHAFSLVHDDLPALDNDDLRRGRKTLHKQTSEAMAILAGDAMNTMAFELIATRVTDPYLCATLTRELAVATNDMIAGQVYDTLPDFDGEIEPIDRLQIIHRHKTASLLRAACRMGAICGEAGAAELDAITQYAEAVGLMFQIMDDLLDVTQSTEQLGKAAGKDASQGKLTYPGLLGVDVSREEVVRLHHEARSAIEIFGRRADPLRELCDYMAVREK